MSRLTNDWLQLGTINEGEQRWGVTRVRDRDRQRNQ